MKVMIYAPHSAIWVHAFPEALVAEALMQEGNEIVYVGCGRQFKSYCVAMSAFRLGYGSSEKAKENICRTCENNKSFIRKEFGLKGPDIAEELSEEDNRHVDDILKDVTPQNYLALEFSGIEVGRLSLYEFLLNHKKNNLEIDPGEWTEYKASLRNSICSALASLRIIEREKPDRLITYNSFYSVNHVCCIVADKFSVPHYLLHAGGNMAHRMETLTLSRGYSYNYITRNPLWKHYRALPCSSEQLGIVTDHLLALFKATSVFIYSAPKSHKKVDLRQKFGINSQQKVLVATMSSHDERFAAVTIGVMPEDCDLVFPAQIDWIRALTEFVARRPELFLIIRVHPREFPNKRESVTSEYATKLHSLLVDLPINVRVNWPSDVISLYDIADIANVFLNSRSTTGLEMSLLGLPVVLYSPDQLYSYPPDLNYVANSREEYFLQIDRALSHGWDIEFSRIAFRWGVFLYCRATLDISESYGKEMGNYRGIVTKGINKVCRKLAPLFQPKRDFSHRAQSLKSAKLINDYLASGKDSIVELHPVNSGEVLLNHETSALKREFERIYAALYRNETNIECDSLQEKIRDFINESGVQK
jgi:hypothetical protein